MHRDLARDGLAAVSVSVDNDGPGVEKKVLSFLRAKHADFTNLRLAPGEDASDWLDNKVKSEEGLPVQQVYDRHGKLIQTFSGGDNYSKVEALAKKLLQDK